MGLFRRIGDIISANLNEMTDAFEAPEIMLKQAIREMEQYIADAIQETAKVLANAKLLSKELAVNERQAGEWQKRAEQAVAAGDDNLACKALARRLEHKKLVIALGEQVTAAADASRTLKHQLGGMQSKLAEAKRTLAALAARQRAADFTKKVQTSDAAFQAVAAGGNAFAKFERMREKVERAEAEADALAELRGTQLPPARECSSLGPAVDDEIAAELSELKRRMVG
ncbi:MAG TPA: PspA/IM30 family protein [Planctomycetaceae bacterium]|jgi:phage shock protein A